MKEGRSIYKIGLEHSTYAIALNASTLFFVPYP